MFAFPPIPNWAKRVLKGCRVSVFRESLPDQIDQNEIEIKMNVLFTFRNKVLKICLVKKTFYSLFCLSYWSVVCNYDLKKGIENFRLFKDTNCYRHMVCKQWCGTNLIDYTGCNKSNALNHRLTILCKKGRYFCCTMYIRNKSITCTSSVLPTFIPLQSGSKIVVCDKWTFLVQVCNA